MSQEFSPIKEHLRAYNASKTNDESVKASSKETETIKEGDKDIKMGKETPKEQTQKEENDKNKMDNLEKMLTTLTTSVANIEANVTNLMNSKSNVTTLEAELKQERESLKNYKNTQDSDSFKIKLLTAIVIKQGQKIDELQDKVECIQKDAKKESLFIDGIIPRSLQETNSERISLVQEFIKDKLDVKEDVQIKQAFRIGGKDPKTIKVILKNVEDKQVIFSNVSNLKGKRNARRKLFFVNDDQLPREKEIKNYYRELQKENKEKEDDKKMQISLRKGKLFVNNKHIKPEIEVPGPADILTLTDEELAGIRDVNVHEGGQHEESNSEFLCYYMCARDTNEVQAGLAKIKIKHGDATHIITAYRLDNAEGPFNQGYNDDEEDRAGRQILKNLKLKDMSNMAIFIARYYGGKHMGTRRFAIYEMLANKAINSMKIRKEKLSRSNRLRRSGSQLSQLSQCSDLASSQEDLTMPTEEQKQLEV